MIELLPLIISGIVAVIGLVLYYFGFKNTLKTILSRKWESTNATVLKSDLQESVNKDNRTKNWRPYIYDCVIAYRYSPKESAENYTNDKIVLIKYHLDSEKSKKICAHLTQGSKVTVYYNPRNPQQSFLVYQRIFPFFVMMFVGIFLLFFGITLFFDLAHKNLDYFLQLIEVL